jgi:hypothetical protein
MAEVVHVFDTPVYLNHVEYSARVAARPEGHLWEAWIEFVARDGSNALRTPRETTQPDRDAVVYWATGLSTTYLEGALHRALEPPPRRTVEVMPEPAFQAPTPAPASEVVTVDRAVLDPYSVGAKGEDLLRSELGALEAWHLRNIIRAYSLAPDRTDIHRLSHRELTEIIVTAVQPV